MRALWMALLLGFLTALCQPAFAQNKSADDELYDRVRQRLAADRDVKGGGIAVVVKDGVVTLSGTVHEEKQKSRAERIAKKTKGVKQVINQLQVEMPPARPKPTP